MKNIFKTMLVCAGVAAMAACTDDRDSNPTIIQPTSFQLNTPAFVKSDVDLKESNSLKLSWSQPQYTAENAPVNIAYEVHVSTTGKFTCSTEEAEADETKTADYAILDEFYTTCVAEVPAESVDKGLVQLSGWADATEVPADMDVYLRVNAFVKEGFKKHNPVASNVVKFKAIPYYIELKPADPIMWFILGNGIGDSKWTNKPEAIGVSNFPLFKVYGATYDAKTGSGEITLLNYFSNESNDFKVLPADYSWDYGFMGGGANKMVYRDGGSDAGNIWCDPAGYYRITVNTATNEGKIESVKYDEAPAVYDGMAISGSFNGWGDTTMTPVSTVANNHVWCYLMENDEVVEFKFKMVGSWDKNWGFDTAGTALVGIGTQNGPNITIQPGKWCIMFNDITGEFSIIAL